MMIILATMCPMDWNNEKLEVVKTIKEKIATKDEKPRTDNEKLLWKQNSRTCGNREELSKEHFRT